MKQKIVKRRGVGTFILREDPRLVAEAIRLRRQRLLNDVSFEVAA